MSQTISANAIPDYRQIAQGSAWMWGALAALVTICIWASWLLAMRVGVQSQLTSFDLAVLRYAVPSVVLLPVLIRAWNQIKRTSIYCLLGIMCGAGVPFFFLGAMGAQYAPAAHSGLLITGTFPLFVTSIAVFFFKEPLPVQRLLGLFAIALGITALLSISFISSQNFALLKGDLFFLFASFCWAIFTISLRVAGLPPLVATAFLCVSSSVVLAILFASGWGETGFQYNPIDDTLMQLVIQGIIVALISGFAYGFAINRIGAESSAAIGSLTPVLVAFGGLWLLGESLALPEYIGLGFMVVGVLLASGVELSKRA